MEKVNTNVLSINAYGLDIPSSDDVIFSGAVARQKDYASFLNIYSIITPTTANKSSDVVEVDDNLKIYPIPIIGRMEFVRKAIKLGGELIEKEKIDCVVCDNPFVSAYIGVQLKKRFGIKLLVHSMAEMIDNPHYLKERKSNYFKNWLAKKNLRDIDLLRVSTKAEIKHMSSRGVDAKLLHYAPFYIDFSSFESAVNDDKFRSKLLEDKFKNIVLFIGRIALQKDIPTLVRAAEIVVKKNPDTLFVIVGDGPEFNRIENMVEHKGLKNNIRLLGKVPYSDVIKYYMACDIFAISSIYEGTCMVLHEAGICSKPVVSTNFAGAIDYVQDGINGFLVDIKDYKTLADKLLYILNNKEIKIKMSTDAKRLVKENFSREEALGCYREMFERIQKI